MKMMVSPETSVNNYRQTLCDIPKERRQTGT